MRPTYILALIVLLHHTAPSSARAAVTQTLPADGVHALVVRLGVANVIVVGDDNVRDITVEHTTDLSAEASDGDVRVTGAGGDGETVTVTMPPDMDVDVRLTTGELHITGVYGDVQVEIDSGHASIDGSRGAYTVTVQDGGIDAAVFLNDASSFRVGTGDIALSVLDRMAHPLTLDVGAGDVTLTVADDYPALLDAQTADGIISTPLPLESEQSAQPDSGRGVRIVGYIGGGGPPVEIRIERGDVRVLPLNEGAESTTTVLVAPEAARGILVDGVFEDAWLGAPSTRVGADADMRVMWDARRLYIALTAREDDWPAVRYTATGHDDPAIDGDDAFHIAIEHGGHTYRLAANPVGGTLDAELMEDGDDLTWDAGARVKPELYPGGWTLEIGVPYRNLGWELDVGDRVGLNVSRARPAADVWEDWAADGEVLLQPAAPVPGGRLPVRLEGETDVPPHVFRRYLGLPADGLLHPSRLPELEARLKRLDWFDDVQTGISIGHDDGTDDAIVVAVGEQRAAEVAAVRIMGASAIRAADIERRYRWAPGWHSDAALEQRRTLTERAYHEAGYTEASVRVQRTPSHLVVAIDEGFIAGLVVEGVERVPEDEVRELLRFQVGAPYHARTYAAALDKLNATLSPKYRAFKIATDGGVRVDRGVRLWVVNVVESPPLSVAWSPVLNLTRVHGAEIGLGGITHRGAVSRTHLLGSLSYLQRTRRPDGVRHWVNYQAAFIRHMNEQKSVQVGVRMSRRTRSHRWQGDKASFSFSTDFFSTEGPDVLLRAAGGTRFSVEGKLGFKEDRSLRRVVSRVRWPSVDVVHNRAISDGKRTYGRLRLTFDGRDTQVMGVDNAAFVGARPSLHVRNGVWVQLEVESGVFDPRSLADGSKAGDDWAYSFAKLETRAYVSPGNRHTLAARFIGQVSAEPLPLQLQPWIGGAHTLRSRGTDYLTGDGGFLLQAEWRVAPGGGVFFGPFVDVARAWYVGSWDRSVTETAIGGTIGVALPPEAFPAAPLAPELLRVDVAYPVSRGGPLGATAADKAARVWVRIDLPF